MNARARGTPRREGRARGTAAFVLLVAASAACSAGPWTEAPSSERSPVVYENDDRLDLYQTPMDTLRRFGERSMVALVEDELLTGRARGNPRALFDTPSWAERRGLCRAVRFAEQPSAATCSGVLVGDDIVLTAGHCARNLDCESLNVVFGFHYQDGGTVRAPGADDVYRCAEVLSFAVPTDFDSVDYGWLKLDRPVSGDKRSAVLERAAVPVGGERLHAFGFGGGVPLKIQTNVAVRAARGAELDYFVTAADAFEGGSGGPVVRGDATVVGILASGNFDYVETDDGCLDVAVLPEESARERVTYAFQALSGLCSSTGHSASVCPSPSESHRGCSMGRAHIPVVHWSWLLCFGALVRRRRGGRH